MRLLARFLKRLIHRGRLRVIDSGGTQHDFGPGGEGPDVAVRFTTRTAPYRIVKDPAAGTAEAWMDGEMLMEDGGSIADFLDLVAINAAPEADGKPAASWQRRSVAARLFQLNYRRLARRNVAHHYDLGNRLYDLFLDVDRHYSCAYYRPEVADLEQAQQDKLAHIAAKLALEPRQRVLDIGCGWGGLALYLARVADVRVTGITLSRAQLSQARERAITEGLADRVDFQLIDYRDVEGRFDRIVSVGMLEHVGLPNFARYFERVRELLTPEGVALIHTIGRNDGPGATDSFTRKYIFPGGYAPALSELMPAIERSGLWTTDVEILRLHYARTLDAWLGRTERAREEIERMYDPRFYRMWLWYLAAARAAFEHGGHVNFQVQLAADRHALPLTRDYMTEAEARFRQSSAGEEAGSRSRSRAPISVS